MKTLMISDLTVSTELDSEAMATVSGGYSDYYGLPYWGGPSYSSRERTDIDVTSFTADQFIGQEQNVSVANGVNTAFADHLKSIVKPTQSAHNNISYR